MVGAGTVGTGSGLLAREWRTGRAKLTTSTPMAIAESSLFARTNPKMAAHIAMANATRRGLTKCATAATSAAPPNSCISRNSTTARRRRQLARGRPAAHASSSVEESTIAWRRYSPHPSAAQPRTTRRLVSRGVGRKGRMANAAMPGPVPAIAVQPAGALFRKGSVASTTPATTSTSPTA